jgi:nitrite reductase/ring-hydroxylating ferredoxin subunit
MIQTGSNRKIRVCTVDQIPAGSARGFEIATDRGKRSVVVVSYQGSYVAYINSCPHTGVSLDWMPDQFLDSSGTLLQCATHGALFRIEDGLCIYGPCLDRSLTTLPTTVEGSDLYLLVQTPDQGARNL